MKLYETTFDDYIKASNKISLHPKANMQVKINFSELSNYIIYGPPGTGKYTQALKIINNFSQYNLKYEKKWLSLIIKRFTTIKLVIFILRLI